MKTRLVFTLALRSLRRQRRRTAIALAITAFSVLAVLFTDGWRNGMLDLMAREGAGTWLGAAQVRPRGALAAQRAFSLEPSLPDQGELFRALSQTPGVTAVSPRVRFFGRIFKGEQSAPFVGLGTDLTTAREVTPRLLEPERLEAGGPLSDGDEALLVASPLAAALGISPGDTVTLLARPADGGLEGVDLRVAGVFRAAFEEEQKRAVVVPLRVAQRLLRMEGRATELLVGVAPLSRAAAVARALPARLAPWAEVEAAPWDEVNRRYQDARAIWTLSLAVMLAVVAAVAALGLWTTLTLIVTERAREIGTMIALGIPRRAVTAIFAAEGFVLGLLGGVAGEVICAALMAGLARRGVRFTPPEGFTVFVRPSVSLAELLTALAVLGACTALISVFPARRAARRPPAEVLG